MATEGWNWLHNSRKWHYFADGRSLCGKWMTLGTNADAEQGGDASSDNCREGNTWGDTFWGICGGQGSNMLGQLLMDVRAARRRLHAESGG